MPLKINADIETCFVPLCAYTIVKNIAFLLEKHW
jgi:hypothetical protein